MRIIRSLLPVALSVFIVAPTWGQRPGPPPAGEPGFGPPPNVAGRGGPGRRQHTATEAQPLDLVAADRKPPAGSEVSVTESGDARRIVSNGVPDHKVGRFPNRDNPNEIREQGYDIEIPADPQIAPAITYINGASNGRGRPGPGGFNVFGITFDGVLMEPGTAESWMGRGEWQYDALGGAVPLGLDTNYAHVQPDGNYHYHGLPIDLMKRLGFRSGDHSPMIGWAADGFPIYAIYGYSDPNDASSGVKELTSSYQLQQGMRPGDANAPDGRYDGAFVQDYEFASGSGDLDECNGRHCVTPEFPDGTYAYFLTRDWPVIPRAFRGNPVELKQPNSGGGMPPRRGILGGGRSGGFRPGGPPPQR